MASEPDQDVPSAPTGQRIGCWAALAMLALLAAGLAILWFNREEIADNFIADELAKRGIPARYEVERIGGRRQVLRDIVIGAPDRPDFTAELAEVLIRYGFGFPDVAEIRLVRPRLYATHRGGRLSFGALDPLIFTEEEAPFELPDLRLRIVDGRGFAVSDLVLGVRGSGLVWVADRDTIPLNPLGQVAAGGDLEIYYQVFGLPAGGTYRTVVEVRREGRRPLLGRRRAPVDGWQDPAFVV